MLKMISLKIIALVLVLRAKGTCATCTLNLDTPLKGLTPIILQNYKIVNPNNRNGDVTLNRGDEIQFLCSGTNNYLIRDRFRDLVNATCEDNNKFTFEIAETKYTYDFSDVKCGRPPLPSAEVTGICNLGASKIEIGFTISNGKFIPRIEVCFDQNSLVTYWTKNLLHISQYSCSVSDQTNFKKEFIPRTVRIDDIYTKNKDYEKGHLAPRCDFFTGAEKRMTFYYINSSPQKKKFNEVNWNHLEGEIRTQVSRNNKNVVIYTGTHNTVHYLDCVLPVRQFFWKVVIEKSSGDGVSFVGVNNLVDKVPSPCSTINCNSLTFLSRRLVNDMKNITKGVIYCCSIQNLRLVPNIQLPGLTEFTGILLTHF